MDFYKVWNDVKRINVDEKGFYDEFLSSTDKSLMAFDSVDINDILIICNVLVNVEVNALVDNIKINIEEIIARDVPQYSNFKNALEGVNRVLLFSENALTFEELGRKLINSKSSGACKKYGENHAKMAQELSLVTISRQGVNLVSNTSFGNMYLTLTDEMKLILAQRLLLRNKFIQLLVIKAMSGDCSYYQLTEGIISRSTAIRRKSNCKVIVELILKNTCYENLLHNISW